MYCPKCGTQNDDNAFKCIRCGTIIQKIPGRVVTLKKSNTAVIVLVIIVSAFIVFMIIGILAAIAIPQFSAYRTRSYNSEAQADMRNLAIAEEAYYVDYSTYTSSVSALSGTYGYMPSSNVNVSLEGTEIGYTITAYHASGNKTYVLTGPGGTIMEHSE
jgi:type IV pilus assembly protein PilA